VGALLGKLQNAIVDAQQVECVKLNRVNRYTTARVEGQRRADELNAGCHEMTPL
jgi:hypothetical protein